MAAPEAAVAPIVASNMLDVPFAKCAVTLKWLFFLSQAAENPADPTKAKTIYEFTAKDIDGNDVSLSKYQGHVCIIVNVASKWGKTAVNYEQLEALYKKVRFLEGSRVEMEWAWAHAWTPRFSFGLSVNKPQARRAWKNWK